jgi:hypothetical protein
VLFSGALTYCRVAIGCLRDTLGLCGQRPRGVSTIPTRGKSPGRQPRGSNLHRSWSPYRRTRNRQGMERKHHGSCSSQHADPAAWDNWNPAVKDNGTAARDCGPDSDRHRPSIEVRCGAIVMIIQRADLAGVNGVFAPRRGPPNHPGDRIGWGLGGGPTSGAMASRQGLVISV